MTKEFKRTFFSSSITVLLIITNIICFKYTVFAKYVLPISFITYPLISLSIIMLVDMYGRRTARHAIISSVIIQLFMLIIYLLVTKLSNQSLYPDLSMEINKVFEINIVNMITSIIAFLILSYIVMDIFENFKVKRQRSIGSLLCIFIFTLLYGSIYILVINYKLDFSILLKFLYTHLISAFLMTMICYGLYYVLRENEEFIEEEFVKVPDKSLKVIAEDTKKDQEKTKKEAKNTKKPSKDKSKK